MLMYGMKTLAICLSFIFLGLNYAASSSSPPAEDGQLFVDVVEFKFAKNYYELISADENTFVVIERIDTVQDRSSDIPTGGYSANNKSGLLKLFMKANDRRRYENILTPSDIVTNGSQGLAVPAGYTLEALSTEGVSKAIISYRVFRQ
jgi:hypothetical protein